MEDFGIMLSCSMPAATFSNKSDSGKVGAGQDNLFLVRQIFPRWLTVNPTLLRPEQALSEKYAGIGTGRFPQL
jgi:hypothetical protein